MRKFTFVPAHATDSYLRMGLMGVSGSGKTWSALEIATGVADGGKIAVIDTEHGSASKYRRQFQFDVLNLEDHDPRSYVEAINSAKDAGYKVLIIDSLSHAWAGRGGVLEIADNETARSKSHNSYMAWKNVTPLQNQLIDTLIRTPLHIIATMRTKSEYVVEKDDRTGKSAPRKVGMAPIQGKDLEYEFDVTGEMNAEHQMIITKSRCPELTDAIIDKPTSAIGVTLRGWLSEEGEGLSLPMPGESMPAPPEPLATQADLDEYEAIRQTAIDAGYLTSKGNEPKPLDATHPRKVVIVRTHALKTWLSEHKEEQSTAEAMGDDGSVPVVQPSTMPKHEPANEDEFDESDPFSDEPSDTLPLATAAATGTNTAHA